MALQRYDLVTNYRCGDAIEEMERSDDGEWVRYEDVAALLRAHQEERETPATRLHEAGCPAIADDESDQVLYDYGECACLAKQLAAKDADLQCEHRAFLHCAEQAKLHWEESLKQKDRADSLEVQLAAKDAAYTKLKGVVAAMLTFARTKPSPQQTLQKSAREMVETFAYDLLAALETAPPGTQETK